MKGFEYTWRLKNKTDCTPCFFCKYRGESTHSTPCSNCIGNEDIALHKANKDTEFTHFEPMSAAHMAVLHLEQEDD